MIFKVILVQCQSENSVKTTIGRKSENRRIENDKEHLINLEIYKQRHYI